MIIIVLFIHMMPPGRVDVRLSLDAQSIYNFITELISHNLGAIAVPTFFVLSGYYFFYSIKEDAGYDIKWFAGKYKKRIRTLLIPYLFWNLALIVAILLRNGLALVIGGDLDIEALRDVDLLKWFWTDPINFPLWYLRDLICMVLLAPLFYLGTRYLKLGVLALLAVSYFFEWSVPVAGFSSSSMFFFGLGAYLGINRQNLLTLCRKVKAPSIILVAVLLLLLTLKNTAPFHSWVLKIYIPIGIVAAVNIVDAMKSVTVTGLASLSGMVFFIYAVHEIFIVGWFNGIYRSIWGTSLFSYSIRYVTEPFLVLLTCMTIYWVLYKIVPGFLAFACGGRKYELRKA